MMCRLKKYKNKKLTFYGAYRNLQVALMNLGREMNETLKSAANTFKRKK